MPPWLDNLWAMTPWAAEPERDAAQAPSLAPYLPAFEPATPRPPIPPPTGPRPKLPDTTYESDDWFQMLVRSWEPKAAVIPPDLFVSHDMYDEVKKFVNRNLAPGAAPREKIECFDYANYQLHRKKFRAGGRPSRDSSSWQILINYPENDGTLFEVVQVPETIEAVMYIKEVLHQNTPVLIGICLRLYNHRDGTPARPNNVASTPFIEPTNHYVVIVGMDRDDRKEPYFQYWDNYYRPDTAKGQDCKLFLKPTMKLEKPDGEVVMAEVRHTLSA